jgi:hypothetical protein
MSDALAFVAALPACPASLDAPPVNEVIIAYKECALVKGRLVVPVRSPCIEVHGEHGPNGIETCVPNWELWQPGLEPPFIAPGEPGPGMVKLTSGISPCALDEAGHAKMPANLLLRHPAPHHLPSLPAVRGLHAADARRVPQPMVIVFGAERSERTEPLPLRYFAISHMCRVDATDPGATAPPSRPRGRGAGRDEGVAGELVGGDGDR